MMLLELLVLGCACGLTGYITHRAPILDIPNERSSHTRIVPRGGGIGIVIPFLGAVLLLGIAGYVPVRLASAILAGGSLVALIGYLDDRHYVRASYRLLVHFLAGGLVLSFLEGMPPLDTGFAISNWGWLGHTIGLLGTAWMINLYNFMDGIDGLAGAEAVYVMGVGGLFLHQVNQPVPGWLAWLLAAASLGFLIWNWSPAKIFMGDISSGFLGLMLAVLMLASARETPTTLWMWLILAGVFVVDATITLIRRVVQHHPWYQSHRDHAYQHAAQKYQNHARVTVAILLINLVWLTPLAYLSLNYPDASLLLLIVAYIPLLLLAFYFRAGKINHGI